MIHAYYCYDSDPIDRWFEEDIELEELMYWHLEKYLPPDSISFEEKLEKDMFYHFGGFNVVLGGPLNNPVTAVLNAPDYWVPDGYENINTESSMEIEIDGVTMMQIAQRPLIVQIGKEWVAKRLAAIGAPAAYVVFGDNGMPTEKDMVYIQGNQLELIALDQRGGTVRGKELAMSVTVGPGVMNGVTIREIALFSPIRMDPIISRMVIPGGIQKIAGQTMKIFWTLHVV